MDNGIKEEELFEPHDGRSLPEDATDENFSNLSGQLCSNFSRERLAAVKHIGRILYPPEPETTQRQSACMFLSRRKRQLFATCAVVAAGVAVGGIVGGLLLRKALGGAVVGGVVGASFRTNMFKRR